MQGIMDVVSEWEREQSRKTGGRVLHGRRVSRVIWETPKAVIFADEAGHFWRYLHAFGQAWPVIVEGGSK